MGELFQAPVAQRCRLFACHDFFLRPAKKIGASLAYVSVTQVAAAADEEDRRAVYDFVEFTYFRRNGHSSAFRYEKRMRN